MSYQEITFTQLPPTTLVDRRVYDRGAGIALEVGRNQFVLLVCPDALERAGFGGLLQRRVHFFLGRFLLDKDDQVHDGNVRRWHAHREAVQFACQFRQDQLQRLGRAG